MLIDDEEWSSGEDDWLLETYTESLGKSEVAEEDPVPHLEAAELPPQCCESMKCVQLHRDELTTLRFELDKMPKHDRTICLRTCLAIAKVAPGDRSGRRTPAR